MDRRRVPERDYNIKELRANHREMARQLVLGGTNKSVAEGIGCTPQTVGNVRNSPLGVEELDRLHGIRDAETMSLARRIEEFAPQALAVLEDIIAGRMPGASVALRARVAGGHLARAGYGEIAKVHALHGHVTKEDIEELKARAAGAANE